MLRTSLILRWFSLIGLIGLISLSATLLYQTTSAAESPVPVQDKAKTKDVLFIGNSYTYAYHMPKMVDAMLRTHTKATRIQMIAKGAYALDMHWSERGPTSPRSAINKHPWDAVILQDQSGRPSMNPKRTIADVQQFQKLIQSQGARTVLFMTWGHGGKNYASMSRITALTYCRAALASGAEVAPVGLAWYKAKQKDKRLELHTPDQSHPNVKGTYLAACVIYATLTGRNPVGLPEKLKSKEGRVLCQLSRNDARWLQQIAHQTCREFVQKKQVKRLVEQHDQKLKRRADFEGKLHKGITPQVAAKTFGKPDATSNNQGRIIQSYHLLNDSQIWLIYGDNRTLEKVMFQPPQAAMHLPDAP